jgi:hypothetical protein
LFAARQSKTSLFDLVQPLSQACPQVSGVPTMRRIIGKREIDVYRNGLMFEKDNVVGVSKR